MWVEPFLASGQVLFVKPSDAKYAKELFKGIFFLCTFPEAE